MPESTRPPEAVALIARLESIDTFARPSSNRQYTGLARGYPKRGKRPAALAHHRGRSDRQVDDRGGHDPAVSPIEHGIDLMLEASVDLAPRSQWQMAFLI